MRPRGGAFGRGDMRIWRFQVPWILGVIILTTFILSVTAAILGRNGVPLARYGILLIPEVWRGQIWRLFTWQFFEFDPIGLLFACMMLYWFGRDLAQHWGPKRFLTVYFGFAAIIGAVMCLIGRFAWAEVGAQPYYGTWPIAEALTIAWATIFPDREILFFFVLRAGGRMLIVLTIGLTALFAAFVGIVPMLPHFLAELMMLIYMGQLRRIYLKWKMQRLQKQKQRYVDNVIRLDRQEDERGPPKGDKPKWLN